MSKEEILLVSSSILSEENIVAVHGTSIAKARSIMETGLNGHRTTYILCSQNRDPKFLATYGWKENVRGDAANVVITIPGTFLEQLIGMSKEEVLEKIKYLRMSGLEEDFIESVMDITIKDRDMFDFGDGLKIPAMPITLFTIPKEFIRGIFVYQNNTNYLSFLTRNGIDYDRALENLTFFNNPNFFDNLSEEQQAEFIKAMREKMGLEQPKR